MVIDVTPKRRSIPSEADEVPGVGDWTEGKSVAKGQQGLCGLGELREGSAHRLRSREGDTRAVRRIGRDKKRESSGLRECCVA